MFIAWRILGGTAIGLASNLSPLYISEIAPANIRGRLVAINQLTIVIGILLAQIVNWWLGRNLSSDLPPELSPEAIRNWIAASWYGTSAGDGCSASLPCRRRFSFWPCLSCRKVPRWLAKNGRRNAARQVLGKLGDESYAAAALADIEATLVNETEKVNFGELFHPRMVRVLVLGVMLAVLQQWCGINVIFNYAENIFHAAGYDISNVLKNIAWTGSVNLLFTFAALGTVDRIGRRPLMLLGEAGLAAIYLVLGTGFHYGWTGWPMLVLVLAAIGCYAMTLAPLRVGRHLRDLSQPHPRRGDGRGRIRVMARLLRPDVHFSVAGGASRSGRRASGSMQASAWRRSFTSFAACRRPKARRWKRSSESWWIESSYSSRSVMRTSITTGRDEYGYSVVPCKNCGALTPIDT